MPLAAGWGRPDHPGSLVRRTIRNVQFPTGTIVVFYFCALRYKRKTKIPSRTVKLGMSLSAMRNSYSVQRYSCGTKLPCND
jgi:hypothetical protein